MTTPNSPAAATDFDTDVLIVGTGPMGSATALALATYGVRVHLVNRWNWLANTPRAHITNQRTSRCCATSASTKMPNATPPPGN
jgi:2,4-dichlorophenol 6-monooxygenase